MKNKFSLLFLLSEIGCNQFRIREPEQIGRYIDGHYAGKTGIDNEGYKALCEIVLRKGFIDNVNFQIYDTI